MNCKQTKTNNICLTSSAVIDCIKVLYAGEEENIELTLYNSAGEKIDLVDLASIQILLYDVRNHVIARYIHPPNESEYSTFVDTFNSYTGYTGNDIETYIDEPVIEDDFDPEKDVWFDNLEINILQQTIDLSSDIGDEYILNKGLISFLINKDITTYMMSGNVYADIRLLFNDNSVEIIKCLHIGILKKNKF